LQQGANASGRWLYYICTIEHQASSINPLMSSDMLNAFSRYGAIDLIFPLVGCLFLDVGFHFVDEKK